MTLKHTLALFVTELLATLCAQTAIAQGDNAGHFSIGTVRTELNAAAVRITGELTKVVNKGSLFHPGLKLSGRSGSLWDFQPLLKIETGEADAFNAVIARFSGNYIRFKVARIDTAGNIVPWDSDTTLALTPDSGSLFWVFPIALGLETDRGFQNLAVLGEIGVMPWKLKGNALNIGNRQKIGLFVQAGYKVGLDSLSGPPVGGGGSADQSKEEPDSEIVRVKVAAAFDLPIVTSGAIGMQVRLIGSGDGWYDIANNAFYHQVSGMLRFSFGKRSFDLEYQNGSGAPNFNEGDQFSANLAITF